MSDDKEFSCVKCGHKKHKVEKHALTGTGASRLMNVQRHKYGFVICEKCGYAEVYELERASKAAQLLDFFTN
tara:strand:+ start:276 stop:491 length:216 start_codon:yes stop_codon:yes gene_type:complete